MQSMTETVTLPPLNLKIKSTKTHSGNITAVEHSTSRSKFRLDPQRALEPAKKKITSVESQRILSALIECIRRLQIIAGLPHVMKNVEDFRFVLGNELVDLVDHHKVIMKCFEDIRPDTRATRDVSNGSRISAQVRNQSRSSQAQSASSRAKSAAGSRAGALSVTSISDHNTLLSTDRFVEDEFEENVINSDDGQSDAESRNLYLIEKQIQTSIRNILRMLLVNSSARSSVVKEEQYFPKSIKELAVRLNELREILTGMLLTTPVELDERMQYLSDVMDHEKSNMQVIMKLDAELEAFVAERDAEMKQKYDIIHKIEHTIKQLESTSEANIQRMKADAEKQENADIRNSETKLVQLQQELNQSKAQFNNLVSEHRESEQALRKKKFQVETEIENLLQKYDQDMGERQDMYEDIDAKYTEEKKQLNELEERFKNLEVEYLQIMEERRIVKERKDEEDRQLFMKARAATTIQAFWRSFKVRKAIKLKKKRKGKGKPKK